MKAQRPFGLALSWARLTTVLLIDVGLLALASHWPGARQTGAIAWWVGVAIAVVATTTATLTYRGITLTSALTAWVWDWSADPESALATGCTSAVDHRRRFGLGVVGIREYRGLLVAMIAVDGPVHGQSQRPVKSPATLAVEDVAVALRQFDVRLDGIDIVSVRTRPISDAGDGPAPNDFKSEGHAPFDQRSTWLVLRMDPQRNAAGVAARDSLASTFAAAVERLAHDLDGRHRAARPLTSVEVAEVDTAVLAGLQATWHRPGWRHLKHFNGYATSFWVSPRDITSGTLERLWLPDTDATVLTIRLNTHRGQPEVSAWVRYHSDSPLPRDMCSGLNRLVGRQLAAVRASMPAPSQRPLLVVPARSLGDSEQLAVPLEQLLPEQSMRLAET
jgi:type VII secretion protein EccE